MGKGPKHEAIKKLLGYLVWVITEEIEIPCKRLGETTWKRPEACAAAWRLTRATISSPRSWP